MIILDTHIWVRWLCGDIAVSLIKKIELAPTVAVSVISCWEVAYLVKRGRLQLGLPVTDWLKASLEESGIAHLPMNVDIARIAAELPDQHRDPADRFIIATAIHHDAKLISLDSQFPAYDELKGRLITK